MRAGELRRKVSFQTKASTPDSFGGQSNTWTDYMTLVPASIVGLSGRELFLAQAINSEVTHQITVRYTSLLADPLKVSAMRVVYINDGITRYFNLTSAINVEERNKEIDLLATEGLNQG